jgi:hypothetical protein
MLLVLNLPLAISCPFAGNGDYNRCPSVKRGLPRSGIGVGSFLVKPEVASLDGTLSSIFQGNLGFPR